jgi:hypothetical protein
MENQMADDLKYIKEKVDNHDKLMSKVVGVVERQAAANEKLNDHIIRTDKRMDKQDVKIDNNHSMILKWSGGLAVIVTGVGLLLTLTKLFPGLAG